MIFLVSIITALLIGATGYTIIYKIERKAEAFENLLVKLNLTKKALYMLTASSLIYFGIGCAILFFQLNT